MYSFVLFATCIGRRRSSKRKYQEKAIGTGHTAGASALGIEIFVKMLRDLGYVEGKNIVFEFR